MKKRFLIPLFTFICLSQYNNIFAQSCVIIDSINVNVGAVPAYGVAWDGTGFWVSGSPNGRIYKFNLAGQKVDTIKDPAKNVNDKSLGIVCVGNSLFTTCYLCDTLYQISLTTKQVINQFVGLPPDERISIAYDGVNKLYFADGPDAMGAFVFDITNGSFSPWGTTSTFAVGLVYYNQKVYGTNHTFAPSQSHIYEIDTLTGSASNNQNWCMYDAAGGLGMTFDGLYIWQASFNFAKIYKIAFIPNGIEEHTTANNLIILNNPVHDQLSFSSREGLVNGIEIYDIAGKRRLMQHIYDNHNIIDVSTLFSGVYIVKFYNKNECVGIAKMLKE